MTGTASTLDVGDFPVFFDAIWGPRAPQRPVTPFEWQNELLERVCSERRWPDVVDLPTGAGKTSLLDLAVFALALDAERPPAERWMPRRVVLVVDRRVIVNQADERGAVLIDALHRPEHPVLSAVSAALSRLSGGGPPLTRSVLRGGITTDETWALRPDVPAVISSTVDQVGSRLLFRGYGISPGMRPVHAGLLGNDTLLLLDEVHLARPFAQTLEAIARYRRAGSAGNGLPDRWQVVQLSATPAGHRGERFPVGRLRSEHPVLRRRLAARKPARLEAVKVPAKATPLESNEMVARRCAAAARELLGGGARTIGVVVNRVDTALRVRHHLIRAIAGDVPVPALSTDPSVVANTDSLGGGRVALLTGRMRPFDRDRLLAELRPRLEVGRPRSPDDPPLVVVATQSIEAGADFDLDAIVTECASLDALRQRFGRVDRDGRLSELGSEHRSVILARSSDVDAKSPDPVYGWAIGRTWVWLRDRPALDFGIGGMDWPEGDEAAPYLSSSADAPLLLPADLDRWVQTSPAPAPADPDVARWLHGKDADDNTADVTVVWRSDLDPSLFDPVVLCALVEDERAELEREVVQRVRMCPPASAEGLPVPLGAARAWLARSPERPDSSDTEAAVAAAGSVGADTPRAPRSALHWSGPDSELVTPEKLRPGDTIVVPADWGGLTDGTWDPSAEAPAVTDVAELALARQRRLVVLRLPRSLGGGEAGSAGTEAGAAVGGDFDSLGRLADDTLELVGTSERQDELAGILLRWSETEADPSRRDLLVHAGRSRRVLDARRLADGISGGAVTRSWVVRSGRRLERPTPAGGGVAAADPTFLGDDEDDDEVAVTDPASVLLSDHLLGVADWARRIGSRLGLGDERVSDLRIAGALHDAGKADPRFQLWLWGGDPALHALAGDRLLARSEATTVRERREARRRSGYPQGMRHELASLALIGERLTEVANAADPTLVEHLVATHHGHGRYRFDPTVDPEPPEAVIELGGVRLATVGAGDEDRLDGGTPERFWLLVRRYGWWRLAWLEAVFRLSDQARSAGEHGGPPIPLGAERSDDPQGGTPR